MTADLDLGYDQEMVMYLNHETRLSGMMNPPVSVVVQHSSVTKNGMQEGPSCSAGTQGLGIYRNKAVSAVATYIAQEKGSTAASFLYITEEKNKAGSPLSEAFFRNDQRAGIPLTCSPLTHFTPQTGGRKPPA